MTQCHYLESIRDNKTENLDPQFCSLLKHHWMEEAQHTKMDTLLVSQLAEIDAQEIEAGVADYLAIAKMLEEKLMAQVQLDLCSLLQATGRTFTALEKQEIQAIHEQSYRWTFLCAGMTHPNFVKVLSELGQTGQAHITEMAKVLSY